MGSVLWCFLFCRSFFALFEASIVILEPTVEIPSNVGRPGLPQIYVATITTASNVESSQGLNAERGLVQLNHDYTRRCSRSSSVYIKAASGCVQVGASLRFV